MNFLAHLHLAGGEPDLLVGNLMGDFVKCRLEGRFSPGITRGIMMHRRIDFFADNNERFRTSRDRLDPSFGLYRGVLVDLFYDHFLAANWDDYSPVPLSAFLKDSFAQIKVYESILPERLQRFLTVIFTDLIPSYVHVSGIEEALVRMSVRVTRENPLAGGGGELRRNYTVLRDDFKDFFPEVEAFAAEFRDISPG